MTIVDEIRALCKVSLVGYKVPLVGHKMPEQEEFRTALPEFRG